MAESHSDELEKYHIKDVPSSMFYIPNFITKEEETSIVNKIPSQNWISLTHRRLQAIPAQLTASNTLVLASSSPGLPDWLMHPVLDRFSEHLALFANSPHRTANHCLINEYLSGQGIMPHEDGAAYYPLVATVSLGGSVVLDVSEKTGGVRDDVSTVDGMSGDEEKQVQRRWRILQEPCSLLVTTDAAYKDTLHGIGEIEVDVDLNSSTVANWALLGDKETLVANGGRNERTTRISLTYRDVLKETRVGAKIFGKGRG